MKEKRSINRITPEKFLEIIKQLEDEHNVKCVKHYQTEQDVYGITDTSLTCKQHVILDEAIVCGPGITFADGHKTHIFGVKTLSETIEWYKKLILEYETL